MNTELKMVHVKSSNVIQVGHGDNATLHVWFQDGSQVVYRGVPVRIYERLLEADSIGSFLNREVTGLFDRIQ